MMTSPTTRNRVPGRGFTLIEICVVLVIIAVALAIVIPRYGGLLVRGSMRSEARRIAAEARYLSGEASRSGRAHYLNFDVAHDSYWVTVDEGRGKPAAQSTLLARPRVLADGVRFKDLTVFPRHRRNFVKNRVGFYAKGENDEAVIHLSDYAGGGVYTVHLKPYNGRCALYDVEYKGYGKLVE